jgi:hypothetical protein
VFVPRTSSTPTATWFWQTEGRSAERVISGVRPSEVHLVGVSIFFEKNFYQLPFTPPPPSRSSYRSFNQEMLKVLKEMT